MFYNNKIHPQSHSSTQSIYYKPLELSPRTFLKNIPEYDVKTKTPQSLRLLRSVSYAYQIRQKDYPAFLLFSLPLLNLGLI